MHAQEEGKKRMNESEFDTKTAIERLGGNKDLYRDLLGLFIYQYESIDTEILKLIGMNKIEELQCLVHTIKGVAGNLGADTLFEDAKTLNIDLKNGNLDTALINKFNESMKTAIKAAKTLQTAI
jgi:HPt (histidine-containing phosphotransfer) domain-containing protein